MPDEGDLALVSQSGAITAALVEWSAAHGVGFSGIVSLGDRIDVDFGDLLDYFALDRRTRAILLYIESINHPRKFMSAARAAARIKPVVVIKSGRHALGAKAAQTHTGALAGSDAVYDAAFRRAGLLRVIDMDELFAAAETLGRVKPFAGNRLAILTNGGGLGVLAVDRLADLGGTLAGALARHAADSSTRRCRRSGRAPTRSTSPATPTPRRYATALEPLLQDPDNDAVLVMNVPTALASCEDAARTVAEIVRKHRASPYRPKPVFANWAGSSDRVTPIFEDAGIPSYPDRDRRGARLHASGALPRSARHPDGDAAQPAGGFQARRRGGAREPRGRAARAAAPGSIRSRSPRCSRPTTFRAATATLARDADAAAAAAAPFLAQGITGRGQDFIARHRPQIGGRRRPSQSHQRSRGPRPPSPTFWRAPARRGRMRASTASPSIR